MQNNSSEMAELIEVHRAELRNGFEYARKKKTGEAFSREVQLQMLETCESEGDVLDLLDFLIEEKMWVPHIIGEIRCASTTTRSVALKAHFARKRQEQVNKAFEALVVVFQAPEVQTQ